MQDISSVNSVIPPDMITAYLETQYHVGEGEESFVLTIGEHSKPLAHLYRSYSVNCAAFITAYNPYSELQEPEVNASCHEALLDILQRENIPFLEGIGQDVSSPWNEQSVLAMGLRLEDAERLGLEFRQNAVVWAGSDAVPKLILLR